jgi:hypothetical protein
MPRNQRSSVRGVEARNARTQSRYPLMESIKCGPRLLRSPSQNVRVSETDETARVSIPIGLGRQTESPRVARQSSASVTRAFFATA